MQKNKPESSIIHKNKLGSNSEPININRKITKKKIVLESETKSKSKTKLEPEPKTKIKSEPKTKADADAELEHNKKPISKYILQPSTIPKIINIDILKKYVQEDINGNKEYFDDLNMTYRISCPKKAEWILNKAIPNGKLVGNGNTSVDIVVDNICIDVSVLTLNNLYTNEKSIMQNFSTGNNLDSLFDNSEGDEAIKIFENKLDEKYILNAGKEIYYLKFICHKKNIYLTCLRLIPENIKNMKFLSFTKSHKSISVNNFIDEDIGSVKLYKSKKRLELRLSKDIIHSNHSIKIF